MYILDISKMKPGDILLTTQSVTQSKVIRKATDSDYSHAMLYVRHGGYIHSDSNGVHSGNVQRLIFEHINQAKVLRVENCQPDVIEKACEYARSKIGTQYSVPQAVKSTIYRNTKNSGNPNRQFCSRLVAQSYAYGGMPITKNSDYCYPEDLACSPRVHEVPNCLRPALPEELEFAVSENPLERQATITNYILTEARNIFGTDIQNFEQITYELLRSPDKDQSICAAFISSGYLDIWKIDLNKNKWRYDEAEFLAVQVSAPKLRELAADELVSAREQNDQFSKMLHFYHMHLQSHDLKYIRLNIELYFRLVQLTQKRIRAAIHVLNLNNT